MTGKVGCCNQTTTLRIALIEDRKRYGFYFLAELALGGATTPSRLIPRAPSCGRPARRGSAHDRRSGVKNGFVRALVLHRSSISPEQRASATEGLPNRSNRTRETGVVEASMAAAEATADAVSSIETWIRSFCSRTRSTSVSVIFSNRR